MQKSVNLFCINMQKSVNLFYRNMQKSVNLFCQKCVKSQNLFQQKCVKSQNVCIFVYFSSKKRNGAIALHITPERKFSTILE